MVKLVVRLESEAEKKGRKQRKMTSQVAVFFVHFI